MALSRSDLGNLVTKIYAASTRNPLRRGSARETLFGKINQSLVFMLRAGCSAGPQEWWTKGHKRCPEPRGRTLRALSPLLCVAASASLCIGPVLPSPCSACWLFFLSTGAASKRCRQPSFRVTVQMPCSQADLPSGLQSPKRRPLLAIQGAALRLLESSVQGETR